MPMLSALRNDYSDPIYEARQHREIYDVSRSGSPERLNEATPIPRPRWRAGTKDDPIDVEMHDEHVKLETIDFEELYDDTSGEGVVFREKGYLEVGKEANLVPAPKTAPSLVSRIASGFINFFSGPPGTFIDPLASRAFAPGEGSGQAGYGGVNLAARQRSPLGQEEMHLHDRVVKSEPGSRAARSGGTGP